MPERKIRLITWVALATATLLPAAPLAAQRITGQIRGTISDPSFLGLPGVTVELTSENIIGTRTTVTTSQGHYRFITLPPGFYNLTFRHPGFKTEEHRQVRVAVGTTTRKDATLDLASLTDAVEVVAAPNVLQSRLEHLSASKYGQSLEEAPFSITKLDAPAFENRTMNDLSDLADFIPNLEFATASLFGASDVATVYIRGLGQVESGQWFDPGVGIYLDGVYLASMRGAVLNLLDVEVVEVLRGPQGTHFGKNTFGGAISIVTRKPGSDLAGHFELRVGRFNRLDGSARVSGGLAPNLLASLSVATTQVDGFVRSLATGEDYYDDNADSARLAGRWQVSKSVTANWTGDVSHGRRHGTVPILTSIQPSLIDVFSFYKNALDLIGGQPFNGRWESGNLRETNATSPGFENHDILGTSLDVYALLRTNLSIRSITSYRTLRSSGIKDSDSTPFEVLEAGYDIDHWQVSEEVWLSGISANGRLIWILGGLYFEDGGHQERHRKVFSDLFSILEAVPGPIVSPPGQPSFLCASGDPPPYISCFGGAGNPLNRYFLQFSRPSITYREPATRNHALFGEATFDLGDKLSLTVGLRNSHEEKQLLSRFRGTQGPSDQLFAEASWRSPTAGLSLAFQATPSVLLYLTASNGFKSGGISDRADSRVQPFAPEQVRSYEAGFKTDFFSNRLRVHAAFFWNDYSDLQLSFWDPLSSNLLINAGEASSKGFDFSFHATLSDSFRIEAGVGHIDAAYTRLKEQVENVTLDYMFPRTPEWNLVVSPEYIFRLRNNGTAVLHADYIYKTRVFFNTVNTVSQEAHSLMNARADLLLPSGAWEAYAYVTNLSDQEYKEHGSFDEGFGAALAVAGRPREWGVGLKYRF